jgi:hypothetical protein
VARRDPSRTVSIHGDKYTYDPDKNKWMSGKKEATPATAAMLDMVLEQLSPDSDEEVESFVGTANITPQDTPDEESPEAIRDKEEAHERKQEAQEDMEDSPPPAEAEAEQLKPPPLEPTSLKPPEPEPEVPTPEPTPAAPEPTPLERRAGTLKDEYTERLRERLAKRMSLLRLFTDKLEDPKKAPQATRAAEQVKPKPLEADQLKPTAEQTDQAAPQAEAEPAREQTPFERRFGRLKDEYTERFAERIKKRMPLARLFTDRLEDPKSVAKKESTPADTPAAKGIGGFSKEAIDALKSIDNSIKEILGLFKENKKEQKQDQTRETTEEQKQELQSESAKREQAVDNLEQRGFADRPETMFKAPEPQPLQTDDAYEEPDSDEGFGQQIKQYAAKKIKGGLRSRGKRLFSGIKSKLGFGAAAEVAEVAAKEPKIAEEIASTGTKRFRDKATGRFVTQAVEKEGVKAAEKVGAKGIAKTAGRSLLKKIPGVGLLAGLAFGAGRLMKGDLLGAVGEVGSGLASTVPGVGTAASVAIDSGLAARDIYKSKDAEKEPREYADGGIVNNPKPLTLFADGGVVDSPTAFSHEGGTGIMGEAGPEAIMPLQKGADGKLGVKMQADPVPKNSITPQTNALEQAEEQRKLAEQKKEQTPGASPTIINNSTTNNNQSGGSGGGSVPTAGPRNSLDLNYYAQ